MKIKYIKSFNIYLILINLSNPLDQKSVFLSLYYQKTYSTSKVRGFFWKARACRLVLMISKTCLRVKTEVRLRIVRIGDILWYVLTKIEVKVCVCVFVCCKSSTECINHFKCRGEQICLFTQRRITLSGAGSMCIRASQEGPPVLVFPVNLWWGGAPFPVGM